MGRHRYVWAASFAVLCFCWLSAGVAQAASGLDGHYECYWWSQSQMTGLNPNNPPPKETRVRIDRWEYSDPIGVPNPDEVILVVHLAETPADAISVRTSWLTTKWSPPQLRKLVVIGDGDRVGEVRIPVRDVINRQHPRKLRSIIMVNGRVIKNVDLPILLGD